MKKIVFVVMMMVLITSCASLNEKDRIVIRDYNEQMSLLKENFPEIYEQYKNGLIVIEKVIPITVFVGKCELHLEDVGRTILSKDLLTYIYGITEKILSQSDVGKIYNRLESKNITGESARRHHVAYVQRVKSKKL